MTSLKSVVLALALIVNDVNPFRKGSIHDLKYIGATLVYLIGVAILVGQLKLFSDTTWRKHSLICLFVEIPVVVVILECSLRFIWWYVQEFVSANAETVLVHLAEERGLEGFICNYMCCGKHKCSQTFTDWSLMLLSFALLVTTVFWKEAVSSSYPRQAIMEKIGPKH